ncbi:carboxypeptidase regulatory-like domain-containing protein [Candidatus Neomarinimicrobiota bacterium]
MKHQKSLRAIVTILIFYTSIIFAQGVTTSGLDGFVNDTDGNPLVGANVVVVHEPSGAQYGASVRNGGLFTIPNMRAGGPYKITVSYIGYQTQEKTDVFLILGQTQGIDFKLEVKAIEMMEVEVAGVQDAVLNSDRTGAATFIGDDLLTQMPSIKRSTRDLTRLDPRSDGNFSFGGKNWLYNNISVDGSNFNNAFGLDDPAPGGQANAESIPFDAVEQVQVSVASFKVTEGGYTGAGINTITKSGTNKFKGSIYTFVQNDRLVGNKVNGNEIFADPDQFYNQTGFTFSGPIIPNKLFFFVNGEMERKEDPGSNFVAAEGNGLGESRVSPSTMDRIRQVMMDVYDYDTGSYQGYKHKTENDKLLLKLDWNISDKHNASFRYNYLDAVRDLGPHGFVLSFNGTGRGPNSTSLPFQNSGYAINNNLHSLAFELNSMFSEKIANHFFASYNRFRDFREPFSADFPTIEIGEDGVTYTTVGYEPFSIHNILDQDVLQITDNISYFMGPHVFTAGVNYEQFKFFNSFNIFRHGLFQLTGDLDLLFPGAGYLDFLGASTYSSLDNFFARTDPDDADNFADFNSFVGSGPFKGELIDVGQFSVYAQDEYVASRNLNLTFGLRVDVPMYNTDPIDNPFSRGLTLLDENDDPETVDQSKLPDPQLLWSPRFGFNWDVKGDRSMQVRGGTGIFTGHLPFVWIGNVLSNPGANPNLYPGEGISENSNETDSGENRDTEGKSVLQQSFDLNAMVEDFKWPQVWTTNFAIDSKLPMGLLGTFEVVYGKDINAIYMRNADLDVPERYLDDGRPYYGATTTDRELNEAYPGEAAGVYVIDNTDEGYNLTITAQVRKEFDSGLNTSLAYTYLQAKNNLKSTEIASVLWQSQPIQGDPNKPNLSYSEFGNRHRIIGTANYTHNWNSEHSSNIGVFVEVAEGNRYTYSGGNRYSFTYAGDVNGDGVGGNDLIYIPNNANDIVLDESSNWNDLNAFIKQDSYLSEHRGEIAERHGLTNPWFSNIDLRVLHNFKTNVGAFQFTIDLLNVANLVNNSWGVRKVASPAATTPLELTGWTDGGEPILKFNSDIKETFIDDPGPFSRWGLQVGLRYMF